MSLEQGSSSPNGAPTIATEQQPVSMRDRFKQVKDNLTSTYIELGAPMFRLGLENIIRKTNVEYEEGFDEAIKAARERGDLIVFVTNHQSLVDTLLCIKPLRKVRHILGKLKLALPFTKKLTTGQRGETIKAFSDVMDVTMKKEDINRVLIIRPEEQEPGDEEEVANSRKEMDRLVSEGSDILIHAEGKLISSRRDETGERNGMQLLIEGSLRSLYLMAKARKRGITFVPMTISGSYNVYDAALGDIDPESNKTKGAMTRNAIRFGANWERRNPHRRLAKIFVSKPMSASEGELADILENDKHNWHRFNAVIGRVIASHLPEDMRGVFKNELTLKHAIEEQIAEDAEKNAQKKALRVAQQSQTA